MHYDPNDNPTGDDDRDGLSNEYELRIGTDPNSPDSDGDGINDGNEVLRTRTDPLSRDTDGDRITDLEETNYSGTNPLLRDSDADGSNDNVDEE
jgi:hypothetical protein